MLLFYFLLQIQNFSSKCHQLSRAPRSSSRPPVKATWGISISRRDSVRIRFELRISPWTMIFLRLNTTTKLQMLLYTDHFPLCHRNKNLHNWKAPDKKTDISSQNKIISSSLLKLSSIKRTEYYQDLLAEVIDITSLYVCRHLLKSRSLSCLSTQIVNNQGLFPTLHR